MLRIQSMRIPLLACALALICCRAMAAAGPACSPCDVSKCPPLRGDCPHDSRTMDECSCCEVCATKFGKKAAGESCGGSMGVCDAGLLCIPDDPYASEQLGTCQEITSCMAFGCDVLEGKCNCKFSTKCSEHEFTFNTMKECQDGLQSYHLTCSYDDAILAHGDTVKVDACTECECDSGYLNCRQQLCPVLECKSGNYFTPEGSCCPVCSITSSPLCTSSSGQFYNVGESWQETPCKKCFCDDGGRTICTSVSCELPQECDEPIYLPDTCCPVCLDGSGVDPSTELQPSPSPIALNTAEGAVDTEIEFSLTPVDIESTCTSSSGQIYNVGESWQETPCMSCFCDDGGRAICKAVSCELPMGCEPVFLPGVCCPVCPDEVDSTEQPSPSPSPIPLDVEGAVGTEIEFSLTPVHVESTCTSSSGQIYNVGESWQETPCKSCFCDEGGRTICRSVSCELPMGCEPVFLPGVCCPVCPDEVDSTAEGAMGTEIEVSLTPVHVESTCTSSSGQIYNVGESWQETPCKSCFCDAGGHTICKAVSCELPMGCEPVFLPGVCCPVCSDEVDSTHSEMDTSAGGGTKTIVGSHHNDISENTSSGKGLLQPPVVVGVIAVVSTIAVVCIVSIIVLSVSISRWRKKGLEKNSSINVSSA